MDQASGALSRTGLTTYGVSACSMRALRVGPLPREACGSSLSKFRSRPGTLMVCSFVVMQPADSGPQNRPRVVIVGAGFGGLFAARGLARAPVDVTVVDRRNYHLFQPLLYQVAAAALPPSDIAWPIRSILSRQRNVSVLMDEVVGIDIAARRVRLSRDGLAFDYLVLAPGSTHSYFGHEEWQTSAPGLKSIDDATLIRRRILTAFERAETAPDPAERARLLRFVIVGAGSTGVELAGAIAELAHHTLARDFRVIDPRSTRVTLV